MVKSKEEIKIYQAEYRKTHKEQRKQYDKLKYIENKGYFTDKNNQYYIDNKEEIKENRTQYYINNKDNIKVSHRVYVRNKRRNDINFNLRSQISKNVNKFLKSQGVLKSNNSILQFLPYTMQELKDHLQSQFEPWMSWNNWGKYNSETWKDDNTLTWFWQIDHIIPQSKLPYLSMEDENFKKCWALENLRPYSAKQNILDGNRR